MNDQFVENPNSRVLIFLKQRDQCDLLSTLLNEQTQHPSDFFTGLFFNFNVFLIINIISINNIPTHKYLHHFLLENFYLFFFQAKQAVMRAVKTFGCKKPNSRNFHVAQSKCCVPQRLRRRELTFRHAI